MLKPTNASAIKCPNERSYATFPKFISGFHITLLWISVFTYEPFKCFGPENINVYFFMLFFFASNVYRQYFGAILYIFGQYDKKRVSQVVVFARIYVFFLLLDCNYSYVAMAILNSFLRCVFDFFSRSLLNMILR